ncbi:MAG TPA: FAD-dependent oxidoreductase [Dehalococcoidia bacterium]|nr:FAD-dependent oxidoreductase [Dehalococcoidia bacterium]
MRLTIDGKTIEASEEMTVLEAARAAGIYIPAICAHPMLTPDGSCRLCLVEIESMEETALACKAGVAADMVVHTDTPRVKEERKEALKNLLAHHPCECLICERRDRCGPYDICLRNVAVTQRCVLCPYNDQCELQQVVDYIGLEGEELAWQYRGLPVDRDNPLFERDYNLCISCARCVNACKEIRGIEAIKMGDHDGDRWPEPSDGKSLIDSGCKYCCACVEVCPTGALIDKAAKWRPEINHEKLTNPCSYECPAHIDVPRYVRLCGEGRYAEALAVIREKVPFPGVLGRVCIHPCEQACRREALNEPIAIKFLKWAAAERDDGQWQQRAKKSPPTSKKVAVIGSGPAGLTASYYLAKQGHAVTVYEALPEPGGMMRVGIPDYRLPPEKLNAEIDIIKKAGVEIKLNTRVESLDDLFAQGYDAVFAAVGAHQGMKMGVEGEDAQGVFDGATFLREINLGQKLDTGNRVAVIGGGNVAIDAARVSLRTGAKKVTIIYRRTRAEMPASPEEVEAALEEGIEIMFLAAPVRIERAGKILRLICIRMQLGEPDASGRRRPVPIRDSEFTTDFDSVIAAIGQTPDIPEGFKLKLGRGNTIETSADTLATSSQGVWAGGDAVSGPASVIEAIAAGRKAASAIDKYLGGTGDISEVLAPPSEFSPCVGKDEGFFAWARAVMPALPVEKRINNFAEVELGLNDEAAKKEGRRCLQCAVRCIITPQPLPPKLGKSKFRREKMTVSR